RLATVLRATTNQKLGDEAQPWWEWWNQYEELYVSGEKYMDYSYYEDTSVSYVAPVVTYAVTDFLYKYPPLRTLISCLVAGTPIQTQSGLRPVEAIRVGDLVVAQNIQSGEIQLRPVLRTTVRPPARTYQIAYTNGEKIQATLGHRWWVIGKGWVKTKDLKEGMSMRTASGYATIESLKDADAAVTYNLLVDQDHTYFVGQSRVLSFDASEAIPTFYKVPGLAPSQLRSE
ncbi:MAG: polymorphic toxin-type HINT domain-containing protein, partial [Pirellula sp.]